MQVVVYTQIHMMSFMTKGSSYCCGGFFLPFSPHSPTRVIASYSSCGDYL